MRRLLVACVCRLLVACVLLERPTSGLMVPDVGKVFRGVRVDFYDGKIAVQFDVKYDATTAPTLDSEIEIRETTGGRGAFATRKIPRGTFLGSYEGDELNATAYRERFADRPPRYVVRVDADLYLDGEERSKNGNFTPALVNHAEDPNVVRYCSQRRPPKIDFFADRDIESGSELLVDYGPQYWLGREKEKISLDEVLDTPFFDPDSDEDQNPLIEKAKDQYRADPDQFTAAYVAVVVSVLVFLTQLGVKWIKYHVWLPESDALTNILDAGPWSSSL